ncbi:unnamed protein product [Rotaria sp. Silwood2]|nr:unnamed protein product [Rotaria sp. Silwood2]
MKNDSSEKFYAWFDVSNNLDDERSWIRKYIEFDRTKRTLTLYSNDCINSKKQAPIVDLNSEMISLSSSATSSSSSSSLCTSSMLTNNNGGRSSVNVRRPSYMLQSLSEYMSPSLSKAFFSSSTTNDDKTATLTPLNNNPIQSNTVRLASFTDSLSDRLSSITTATNRQSKTKFSYFFGRSSTNNKSNTNQQSLPSPNINIDSLKRTKSVTKLERQKRLQQSLLNSNNQQTSPSLHNIPSNRSRSHESLFVVNSGSGNGPLGSISTTIPSQLVLDNCHIRRLHPSILQQTSCDTHDEQLSSYQCIQIGNKNEKKNYYLRSKQYSTDSSLLVNNLRQTSLETITNLCGLRTDNSLDIWILEAKGLPVKKKYYVKIYLDDDIYGKTTSKERREILFWGENFTFKDIPEGLNKQINLILIFIFNLKKKKGCSILRCKIYREIERRKQKQINGNDIDLIGYVDILLSTITGNQFIEQWYPLQIPSGLPITGKDKSQRLQDGSFNIRIKAKYQAIEILPIESYLHLQEYIRRDYLRLIRILEPHISLRDKDEIATSLTRIAQSLSFSTSFLVDIVQAEILSTPDNSLTFRGNSIATKSMEAYMKLIGETYLRETLTRFVTDIVSSKNSNDIDLEVDPGRVSNLQNLERNQITLRLLCEKIWLEIQQSHSLFPQELKRIFWKLRQLSSSDETMFNLISGSVFLRFLCPAILSPNLFGLTQEYPNEKSSRKLTLIAKTLQTLANFSRFGPKESYMKFMNDFVGKESENMRRFLAQISTIDHDYDEPRFSHRNNPHDDKCDIDLVARAVLDEQMGHNDRSRSSSGTSGLPSRSFRYLQEQYNNSNGDNKETTVTTIEDTTISAEGLGLRRSSDAHVPSRAFKILQDQCDAQNTPVNRTQGINNRDDLVEIYNKPPPSFREREPEAPRYTGSTVPSRSFRFLQMMTQNDDQNNAKSNVGYNKPQQLLNKYDEQNFSSNINKLETHPSRSFKYLQEITSERPQSAGQTTTTVTQTGTKIITTNNRQQQPIKMNVQVQQLQPIIQVNTTSSSSQGDVIDKLSADIAATDF